MQYVCKNIEECNPGKQRKVLVAFFDKTADMINNKKTRSNSNLTIYHRQKTSYFRCFYYTIIF